MPFVRYYSDTKANGVDKNLVNYGCEGGNTESAYDFITSVGGLVLDKDYSYTSYLGKSGECDATRDDYVVTVDNYYTVKNEESMMNYVLATGPLSVCLDASDWSSYKSGIVSSCGNTPDHCVQVVGVNLKKNYWIVSNTLYCIIRTLSHPSLPVTVLIMRYAYILNELE